MNRWGDHYLALFGITDRRSEKIVMEWKDAPTIDKAKTILNNNILPTEQYYKNKEKYNADTTNSHRVG